MVHQSNIDPNTIKGIGFDATCSLTVFSEDTDEPVTVTGPSFEDDGNARNVILWLDHRPVEETEKINATGHNLLRYVGGKMSIEMEIPKVLWLKNNMPPELFDRCKFYDLADALTHLATGSETRSFCSTVCKQGFVPVGVDGSIKGWQEDFYHTIGLGDLVKDDFKRMGGVDGVVSPFFIRSIFTVSMLLAANKKPLLDRTASTSVPANWSATSPRRPAGSWAFRLASPSEVVSLTPMRAGSAPSAPRSTPNTDSRTRRSRLMTCTKPLPDWRPWPVPRRAIWPCRKSPFS